MGIGNSKAVDRLKHHPFFAAFTGKEKIHQLNPQQQTKFWRELWSIPVDPWTVDPKDLMANLRVYADQLRDNSYETKNYASLILQVIGLLSDVSVNNQEQIILATRAVFNLRTFTQSFIETTGADQMRLLFDVPNTFKQQNHFILRQYVTINNNPTQSNENSANNNNENNTNVAQPDPDDSIKEIEAAEVPTDINLPWELLETIVNFLINKDFSYMTASLHEEVMKLFLTLLSTQMFQNNQGQHENLFLNLLFNVPQGQFLRTADLIETLLLHFVLQQQGVSHASASSIIFTSLTYAASAFWKLPWNAYSLLVKRTIPDDLAHLLTTTTPYADLALDLILILINYTPANVSNTSFDTFHNPFKFALNTFVDDEFGLNKDLESDSTLANTTFKLSISRLYNAILNKIDDERTVLLLYFLLHGNNLFSSYVLSRTDIETMILPVLKVLYGVVEEKPQRVYIILITLLILTNDEAFCNAAQTISLKTVPWYKEKFLSNISLAGIITLVLLRTAQISVRQLRDNYLLSNCIACVANMAPHFEDLHPFAAFKLISTLHLLTKKHSKYLLQYSNYRNELLAKRAAEKENANTEEKKDGSDDVTLEEDEMLLNIEVGPGYYINIINMKCYLIMILRPRFSKVRM
jgi:hypothetical protein